MGPPNFSRLRSPAITASQPGRRAQSSRGRGSAPPPAGQGGTPSFLTATTVGGGRVERRCRPGCRCRCRCLCRYHRRPAGSASQQNAVIHLDAAFLGAASRHEPSHPNARPSLSPAPSPGPGHAPFPSRDAARRRCRLASAERVRGGSSRWRAVKSPRLRALEFPIRKP